MSLRFHHRALPPVGGGECAICQTVSPLISAAQGSKFAKVMKILDEKLKEVTPEEGEETKKILLDEYKKEQVKASHILVNTE